MGFKTYKRTELDEQENPYPILYMRLEKYICKGGKIYIWISLRK